MNREFGKALDGVAGITRIPLDEANPQRGPRITIDKTALRIGLLKDGTYVISPRAGTSPPFTAATAAT